MTQDGCPTAITKKTLTCDLCTHTKAHSQSLKTLHKDFHHIGNARQTRSSGNQIAIRFSKLVVHHDNCHPPLGSRLKQLAEIETTITECSSSNSIAAGGNLLLGTVITDLEIVCGGEPIL